MRVDSMGHCSQPELYFICRETTSDTISAHQSVLESMSGAYKDQGVLDGIHGRADFIERPSKPDCHGSKGARYILRSSLQCVSSFFPELLSSMGLRVGSACQYALGMLTAHRHRHPCEFGLTDRMI